MSLLSTCRSTAPAPARMMTSAVPFLILFLAGVSFAERYWVTFGLFRTFGAGQQAKSFPSGNVLSFGGHGTSPKPFESGLTSA